MLNINISKTLSHDFIQFLLKKAALNFKQLVKLWFSVCFET